MQPVDTMTINLHMTRSNAGSIIKHAVTLLQQSRVQVEAGYIVPGPMIERIDLDGVTMGDVLEYVARLSDERNGIGVKYAGHIDLAGRIHFGTVEGIAVWMADHPVIFPMDCPFCLGAGCPKCNDTGKTYRTA